MNKSRIKALLYLIAGLVILIVSCKHEPEEFLTDPCLGVTITVTGTVTAATSSTSSNGSITASATGGNGFQYSLNNGTFQSSGTFANLAPATYTVFAKNSNGCIGSAQFTVGNGDPCSGVIVSITAVVTNASSTTQNNGSINATATGGSGFQYKIGTGAYQSSGLFSNLAAGTYTITAKNSNGCTGTAQFSVAAANICGSTNITISTSVVNSDKCAATGSITTAASGSTGFQYQLNTGTFQASNVFNNVLTGNYTVTVKDANGCTKSSAVTVGVVNPGTLFSNVKSLILVKCKDCHTNGGNNGGVNFDDDCNIVAKKDRIKARAVDGVPSRMPPPPNTALTATEKQKITDWINAGGTYSN